VHQVPMTPVEPVTVQTEQLWAADQTADFLRISLETLYRLRAAGDGPPAYRIGRQLRFVPDEVRGWLEQRRAV
jgi:excisionase family DNA binding protein